MPRGTPNANCWAGGAIYGRKWTPPNCNALIRDGSESALADVCPAFSSGRAFVTASLDGFPLAFASAEKVRDGSGPEASHALDTGSIWTGNGGMKQLCASIILCAALAAGPAVGGTVIVGVGGDDVLDETSTQSVAVDLEYHFDPFVERRSFRLSPALALQYDGDGDLWVGGGVGLERDLKGAWFLEGSLMGGYYDAATGGTPLGNDLIFRTLVGVGRHLDARRAISLSIDHKSNRDLGRTNPGSETLLFRYRLEF